MPGEYSSGGDGLELEERESGDVVGGPYKSERGIGDVEDVFVQVVDHGAIGHEGLGVCSFGRGGISVQGEEEGVRDVVAGGDDDFIDAG